MAKRLRTSAWAKALTRSFAAITRSQLRAGTRVARQAVKRAASTATATARAKAKAPAGAGDWIAGVSVGSADARRYRLYRPPGVGFAERPPLLVIHGAVDRVVSVSNAQAAAQIWADAAGARASAPRSVQRGKRYPMSVTDFKQRGSTVATLVEVSEAESFSERRHLLPRPFGERAG